MWVIFKILERGELSDSFNQTEIDIIKLLDYPNILNLFPIKNHIFMVLEIAAEGDFVSHIESQLSTRGIASAHLPTNGLFSSPSNKNILAQRDLKLCDFGLAIKSPLDR